MKWSLVFGGVFMAYVAHSMWTIYSLFTPEPCPPKAECLQSFLLKKPALKIQVFSSVSQRRPSASNSKLVWENTTFDPETAFEQDITVSFPERTRNNGSMFVHVFVVPVAEDPWSSERSCYAGGSLTTYAVPQPKTFNLMGDEDGEKEAGEKEAAKTSGNGKREQMVTHWRSQLTLSVMTDTVELNRRAIPGELMRFLRVTRKQEYLPMLYLSSLNNRMKHLVEVNKSSSELPLKILYEPISFGKLRFWVTMESSMGHLLQLGFTEKDTDEVKGLFVDTNLYLLMMTIFVSAFHLLFDFLAFKNDISYWKERKSMIGLSTSTVLWRCFSTIVVFLYLKDQETSLLVLIPAGVGAVIEVWKVKKALKVSVKWSGGMPSIEFGSKSAQEEETENFDTQAMKYLSYLLIPLVMGLAVYSLLYTPHKSWYSWCITSLVNGIYAFGFIFMLPQLFLNYKLKSVAHLPWRAFMYKAFNTFIDDVFAFIITMPTAHRLACFRDDFVFLIYLYQRWLYPVDKTRVNEYGQVFEKDSADNSKDKTPEEKKKSGNEKSGNEKSGKEKSGNKKSGNEKSGNKTDKKNKTESKKTK